MPYDRPFGRKEMEERWGEWGKKGVPEPLFVMVRCLASERRLPLSKIPS